MSIVHVTTGFGGYKKESQVFVLVASEPSLRASGLSKCH